jgi:hypothetical protein
MTKGVTNETVDGMSIAKIDRIIDQLKRETYRFAPVRREYIKKKAVRSNVLSDYPPSLKGYVIRQYFKYYSRPSRRYSLRGAMAFVPGGAPIRQKKPS